MARAGPVNSAINAETCNGIRYSVAKQETLQSAESWIKYDTDNVSLKPHHSRWDLFVKLM